MRTRALLWSPWVTLMFEPRDVWVGLYWTTEEAHRQHGVSYPRLLLLYICLIPMFPIRISLQRSGQQDGGRDATANG